MYVTAYGTLNNKIMKNFECNYIKIYLSITKIIKINHNATIKMYIKHIGWFKV